MCFSTPPDTGHFFCWGTSGEDNIHVVLGLDWGNSEVFLESTGGTAVAGVTAGTGTTAGTAATAATWAVAHRSHRV